MKTEQKECSERLPYKISEFGELPRRKLTRAIGALHQAAVPNYMLLPLTAVQMHFVLNKMVDTKVVWQLKKEKNYASTHLLELRDSQSGCLLQY